MKKFLKNFLIIRRIKDGLFATRYFNQKYFQILKWMFCSKEDTNYTYDLTKQNLDELLKFSIEHGRNFVLFRERPKDHWYPGAGIGISFMKK